MRAYLLDIEGTTTPIDFVTKTLFPFARRELAGFVAQSLEKPVARLALVSDSCLLSNEYELESGVPAWPDRPNPETALPFLYWLMDHDRKSTALKSIQGRIWEAGYSSGQIKGEVYPDVWPAVRRWKERGARIYIYSSGSVLAQRLLFQNLPEGDMTPLIDGYFDTTTGSKRDPESYRKIASEIGLEPGDILFLSDIAEEVQAGRVAGMEATVVARDVETILRPATIRSFDVLD